MSGTEDLKNLLDRLKDEVGPLPEPPQRREAPPRSEVPAARALPADGQAPRRPDYFPRSYRAEAPRDQAPGRGQPNLVWSENKETILFGMLTALIAAFGGILSGLDYLVLIGGVVFMLFSFMMLLTLFGYYLNSRRKSGVPEGQGLAEKVEALSRRVESLSSMAASGGGMGYSPSQEKERELEHKVDELRVLVKTLSRAVEQQDR
jgi:hypothetical protein